MRGVYLGLLLLLFVVTASRALNCQPCKLLEARKTHANDTHTREEVQRESSAK